MLRHSAATPPPAIALPPPSAPTRRGSLLGRRLFAWGLEATILVASVAGPFYWGDRLQKQADAPTVPLTPALQVAQTTTAKALGLPPRSLPQTVPLWTNVLWSAALGLPLVLVGGHLYRLSRCGASGPKRWLGLQIVTLEGQVPSWRHTLLREGLGKWGGPLLVAYGLWRFSGAFPSSLILVGLGSLALIGESLSGLFNHPRRSWHDWLAGTCVVDEETGALVRLAAQWDDARTAAAQSGPLAGGPDPGGLTSVVLSPMNRSWLGVLLPPQRSGLGVTLLTLLLLGGLAGMGGYHWLSRMLPSTTGEDPLFERLVGTLTAADADLDARRAAILALGRVESDRATPFLVDLLAQAQSPQQLEVLQQALISRGPEAIAPLRRLNQSLTSDLAMQSNSVLRQQLTARLQTVNRVLAKLILLEDSQVAEFDLSQLHLGHLRGGHGDFTLSLPHQVLAGIQWQGTVLNGAELQGAQFFHPGADQHADTYDDQVANLNGADLTEANLSGANLYLAQLRGSSLLRATLPKADLTLADLTGANLEGAVLIQAQLDRAQLAEARMMQVDLTLADLSRANLTAARLRRASASGATLRRATLTQAEAREADFTDANLSRADLSGAILAGAQLQGANLRQANLRQANLRQANLQDVQLQGADLDAADVAGARFQPPNQPAADGFVTAVPSVETGDRLRGVDFSQVRNLSAAQLNYLCAQGGVHPACTDQSTPLSQP